MSDTTLGFRRPSMTPAQIEDLDEEIVKMGAKLKAMGIEPGVETIRKRVKRGANIVRQRIDFLIEQDRWPHKRLRRHSIDGDTQYVVGSVPKPARKRVAKPAPKPTAPMKSTGNHTLFSEEADRIKRLRLADRKKLKEIGGIKS